MTSVAPAHTDWLYHHLTVSGPAAPLDAFRAAASGSGVIPWVLDLDRVEEDAFLRLATAPQRSLSLEGARLLAGEVRDAVGWRHALAVGRVGQSRACPFDLHTLLPVPGNVLGGPVAAEPKLQFSAMRLVAVAMVSTNASLS